MFNILFGWSKASKCKKAIKSARCRLGLLKNKREAIVRQLRKDLAELIQSGHEESAFNRVDQLIEDESLVATYELLDQFCQFILTQLSYIRRNKDCPNDINEAVSSLIFASARCGDLPELCAIRKFFGKHYGEKFVTMAIELLPGNLVNKQLKEDLCRTFAPDDLKYRMMDEIADNCLQQQFLAIQDYPDWHQLQVKDNKGCQVVGHSVLIKDTNAGSKVHPSEIEKIKSDISKDKSLSEKLSTRSSKKCTSAAEKISRRKSTSGEYKGVMDLENLIYNHKQHQHSTRYCRKHQKPSSSKILELCQSKDGSRSKQFNTKMSGSIKPKRETNASHIQQGLIRSDNDDLNPVMELLTIHKKSQRNSYSGLGEYHEFDYPEYKVGNGNNETKEVTSASQGSYAYTNVSNPRTNVSLPIGTGVPYTRAMTMPQERDRNSMDKILRTYSCLYEHPNHVHPMLPNYDDIAAKFTALKREQLQNKKLD